MSGIACHSVTDEYLLGEFNDTAKEYNPFRYRYVIYFPSFSKCKISCWWNNAHGSKSRKSCGTCISTRLNSAEFKRSFPDGSGECCFRVPAGLNLVVTDAEWIPSGISSLSLIISIENFLNPSLRGMVFKGSVFPAGVDDRPLESYVLKSGFVVSPGGKLIVEVTGAGSNLQQVILRGHLVPN